MEDFLRKLGAWEDEDPANQGVTLAGALMFGRERLIRKAVPNLHLDYVEKSSLDPHDRYADRVTSEDGTWEPNLFNFYRRVYPRLTEGLKVPFSLDEMAMRRAETPFHHAVREAFVNSLVHANYRSSGSVRACRFRDALTFENPGRSLVPIHKIMEARQAGKNLSQVRNPNLLRIFILLGWAERLGSGFPLIFRAWDEGKRYSPKIEEDLECDTVKVTLPLASCLDPKVEADIIRVVGAEFALLPELDKDILIEAFQQGEVSNELLQSTRRDHARDIGARLKYLADRGWLEREGGAGRGRKYRFAAHHPKSDLFQEALTPRGEGALAPRGEGASLEEMLAKVRISRPDRAAIEAAILAICTGRFVTLKEFADLLARKPGKLREDYLSPMIADGRLVRLHPEFHAHPQQAYTAKTAT